MSKKKILIVCKGFYPQNSPRSHRATELAKEFARQGHQVTVITPKNQKLHPEFEKEHNLTINDLGVLRYKNPNFGNSKIAYFLNRVFFRLLSLSIEYPQIELMFKVKKALKNVRGYDLLISVAVPYPIHWGVARVWEKQNAVAKTWVADCGDPYMGNTTDSFRKWFYFKYVEKWFMRKTDFVTIPIDEAKSAYYTEFHSKIKIIPQGFKFDSIEGTGAAPKNPIPIFVYAGGFIPGKRDPRVFLDYLTTVKQDFKFYIYTNSTHLIERYKTKLGSKLIISSYIPREDLLSFLSKADFLVNFDNNTEVQSPSKLIDYALVKRPIINIKEELDVHVVNQFLHGNYTAALKIDNINKYRIENVCANFLSLIPLS